MAKKATKSEKQLKNLLALRDAVIEDYEKCQQDYDADREFTTSEGNGVNSAEAICTLSPLYDLAKKCQ